jgi:serine/threonine protein kinase
MDNLDSQRVCLGDEKYGWSIMKSASKVSTAILVFECRGHSIAVDIVRGLAFFHTHNILHLDMKSPNCLLNGAGAKIADTGLGRKVKDGESVASKS